MNAGLKKYCSIFINTRIKAAKQLYWNQFSAWVFSCKFAAYFQNTLT